MTLEQTGKVVANIQRLLKVRQVSLDVARTEKGMLAIKYIKDTEDYQILLDSVPLDMKEYDNRELKLMLETYLFAE